MEHQLTFNKETKNSKTEIVILSGIFITGFLLWLYLSPIVMGSFVFWFGAVVMAIPGYVALESFGAFGLNAKFVKNIPRFVRILFGVFWALICLLFFSFILILLSSLLSP